MTRICTQEDNSQDQVTVSHGSGEDIMGRLKLVECYCQNISSMIESESLSIVLLTVSNTSSRDIVSHKKRFEKKWEVCVQFY